MATGVRGYLNNYSTTLNGAISNSIVTIDVQAGLGAAVGTALTTSDYVALTIDDGTNIEIVHCTSVSTDELTVERGQEGTSGTAFADTDPIEVRPTAASLPNNMWEVVETQTLGSASATVDFDISDGADYRITIVKALHGNTANWNLTVFISGPTEQVTNYEYSNLSGDSNNASFAHDRSISASAILIAKAASPNSDRSVEGTITLVGKTSAVNFQCDYKVGYQIASGYIGETVGRGQWKDASNTLVQARISVDSGTITAGAKFLLERRNF